MKFLSRLVPVAIVFLAVAIYSQFQPVPIDAPPEPTPVVAPPLRSLPIKSQRNGASFNRDGRTSCSQMTSCAEAKYFLQHCPNVKMDGDHDGVP